MPTPEDVLNNKNEGNENINQSQESNEIVESSEEMQKRLTQEITNKNEELKQEDIKIENANNSIGLSGEEVQEEKTALNLDSEISKINNDGVALTAEAKSKIGDTKSVESDTSFLTEKGKQEKFDAFEAEFSKYKSEQKQEYNIQELSKSFENAQKPEQVNKILESLPKEVITKITEDPQNSKAINAIREWKDKIGSQIGSLSNQRIDYYDNSNKKEAVKLGTVPENPKDYLNVTANAARFVPKEVSEKFVKDAVDAFVDKNKKYGTGDRSFAYAFGQESGSDVIRNLCESGYKEEAKKLLMASFTDETRLSTEDRIKVGNSRLLFKLSEQNLLSKEEVREILDKSGYLEEPKQEIKNEGWG